MAADSVTTICNRALQALGCAAISSLTENSKNSRECQRAYDPCRKALLRSHPWIFATAYASLAAVVNPPAINTPPTNVGGQTLSVYNLPSDYIRLVSLMLTNSSWLYYQESFKDTSDEYQIQSGSIITWIQPPLNIRYVYDFTNAALFDPIFQETLSAFMAQEMCEMLTQSNTKKAALEKSFETKIAEARRINAFDKPPGRIPEDTYLAVRH